DRGPNPLAPSGSFRTMGSTDWRAHPPRGGPTVVERAQTFAAPCATPRNAEHHKPLSRLLKTATARNGPLRWATPQRGSRSRSRRFTSGRLTGVSPTWRGHSSRVSNPTDFGPAIRSQGPGTGCLAQVEVLPAEKISTLVATMSFTSHFPSLF